MNGLRSFLSGAVFWAALALMGVLAIPAAVLVGLIAGIYRLGDALSRALEGGKAPTGDCKMRKSSVS